MLKFLSGVLFLPCVTFADTAVSAERLEIIRHLKQEIAKQYVLEDKTPAILDALKILSVSILISFVTTFGNCLVSPTITARLAQDKASAPVAKSTCEASSIIT